jgi:hypothetical protein
MELSNEQMGGFGRIAVLAIMRGFKGAHLHMAAIIFLEIVVGSNVT